MAISFVSILTFMKEFTSIMQYVCYLYILLKISLYAKIYILNKNLLSTKTSQALFWIYLSSWNIFNRTVGSSQDGYEHSKEALWLEWGGVKGISAGGDIRTTGMGRADHRWPCKALENPSLFLWMKWSDVRRFSWGMTWSNLHFKGMTSAAVF